MTSIAPRFATLSLAILSAAGLAACGGGGASTAISTTTVGQELSDLQRAYESGALSTDEYQQQREDILERDR